jgi:DNA processing protein
VLRSLEKVDVDREAEILAAHDAKILAIDDPEYPALLKEMSDAPPLLFVHGSTDIFHAPCVSVVGTRSMTPYGKRVVETYVPPLVQAGVTTVSGLARGIDTCVAQETLRHAGATVAVLGQGIATLPSGPRMLAQAIVKGGGSIVSEFPLQFPPDQFTFPLRNRVIAGLSVATIVVEAPESSGALITAQIASDIGREVFAVPGQVFDDNAQGCHSLLWSDKARISSSPRAVLESLNIVLPAQDSPARQYVPRGEEEQAIWKVLTSMPTHIDTIIERTGVSPGLVGATLTTLEMLGIAKTVGANAWVRT